MSWVERTGWVVAGLALVFSVLAVALSRPLGTDAVVYRIVGTYVTEGRSPYPGFQYPPPAALAFVPMALAPEPVAVWIFEIVLVAVCVAVAGVLVSPLPRPLRPWCVVLLALFFPLLLDLSLGNVNLLVTGLMLAAWARRHDQPLGGALLGCALMLKPIALLVVVFYLAAREWQQLRWAAALVLGVTVVTLPWLGPYWIDYAALLLHRAVTTEIASIRPAAGGTALYVAMGAAAAAIALRAGILARRSSAVGGDLHGLALACAPLATYGVLYIYLVLALPLLVSLIRVLARRPVLLALPAVAYLGMEQPFGQEALRFGGYVATIALGAAVFLVRARGATTDVT